MRDIAVVSVVLVLALVALRRPWIGVMLWVWISIMNPHRYTYGFAYDAPVAMIAGGATLLGFLFAQDKTSPFKGAPVVFFVLFTLWVTISWQMGLDSSRDYAQWNKVMKVNLMVILCLMVLRTREHILVLAWVLTLSVALLSVKGGVFTVLNGGNFRVWGPPGSWIHGNNEFAVATIMAIPLLRFLQLQLTDKRLVHLFTLMMLLCAASALGSYSRGALLAVFAMTLVLWWRGTNRVRNGLFLLILAGMMLAAMPEQWTARMDTIQAYEEDLSALGRISAWWVSWNLALEYPFGVGFNIAKPEIFAQFSPYGVGYGTPVAHSIWFQVLGHHGFVGLGLYMLLWLATWRCADRLRKVEPGNQALKWVRDLGGMAQVSMVAFWVGGAFLQLTYYDFPYYVMAAVVLTQTWVRSRGWEREAAPAPTRWRRLLGLLPPGAPVAEVNVAVPAATGAGQPLPARGAGQQRP